MEREQEEQLRRSNNELRDKMVNKNERIRNLEHSSEQLRESTIGMEKLIRSLESDVLRLQLLNDELMRQQGL